MSEYELILAIKDYCNGDLRETVSEVNNLISKTMGATKFVAKLSQELEEFCCQKGICTSCGHDELETITYQQTSEHFGFPAHESIYVTYCKECGVEN